MQSKPLFTSEYDDSKPYYDDGSMLTVYLDLGSLTHLAMTGSNFFESKQWISKRVMAVKIFQVVTSAVPARTSVEKGLILIWKNQHNEKCFSS